MNRTGFEDMNESIAGARALVYGVRGAVMARDGSAAAVALVNQLAEKLERAHNRLLREYGCGLPDPGGRKRDIEEALANLQFREHLLSAELTSLDRNAVPDGVAAPPGSRPRQIAARAEISAPESGARLPVRRKAGGAR